MGIFVSGHDYATLEKRYNYIDSYTTKTFLRSLTRLFL